MFENEGQMKTFLNIHKLKEFITNTYTLQKLLKGNGARSKCGFVQSRDEHFSTWSWTPPERTVSRVECGSICLKVSTPGQAFPGVRQVCLNHHTLYHSPVSSTNFWFPFSYLKASKCSFICLPVS